MFLFIYCMPCEPPLSDKSDNPMCGIGASFQALSLKHHDNSKPVHHATPSSWLSELYRLELLSKSHTPAPVTRNAKNKPLLAPSKFNGRHLSQSNQSRCSTEYKVTNHTSNNCRRHYCIIILLFVLFISLVTNVILVYCIITS